jgi:hypothetical protein
MPSFRRHNRALFSLIRQQHPSFRSFRPGTEAQKVLRGMAQVMDALNPVRTRKSMEQRTDELLEEPEATFALAPSGAYCTIST